MATDRPATAPVEHRRPSKRLRQVLWFAGIWCASLAVLSSVAYVIRAVLV